MRTSLALNPQPESDTRWRGCRLTVVRAAWAAVSVLALGLFVVGLPARLAELSTVCVFEDCSPRPLAEWIQQLQGWGLSIGFYAGFVLALEVIFMSVCSVIAVSLAWRRSREPMALFIALMLVTFGTASTGSVAALAATQPAWRWVVSGVTFLGQVLFFTFGFLFPDGRFVPRWSWVLAAAAVVEQAVEKFYAGSEDNWPLALQLLPFFGLLIPAVIAQIYRFRRVSTPVQRQQTKWVVFGVTVGFSGFLGLILLFGVLWPSLQRHLFANLAGLVLLYGCFLLIPLSLAMAVLRSRLWDIDFLINRTLMYSILTTSVVGIYVLVVGTLGMLLQAQGNFLIALLATGLVAVLFQPLRERFQRGVNRLLYGQRDDPYAVLSGLGRRLEAALAPDAVLPTIVATVKEALKLPYAAIALDQEGRSVEVASIGTPAPNPLCLPLNYQGETIGQLILAPRTPGETFTPAERRLLDDLAHQVGIAAAAVRLTVALQASLEELRRSRERLVAAQEEERRRIQRDLHDGLGPVLASMRLRLEACLHLAESLPPLVGHLERLDELVGQATADIRRLVYDLRPPVLDQLGLVPALRQHIERFSRETGIEVHFTTEAGLAVPAAAEVAIFRVVHEALVNAQKHARASQVAIRLQQQDEQLILEISDDGIGFALDSPGVQAGTGLGSMRERAELLGGVLSLVSQPGAGTELVIHIPIRR